MRRRRRQRPRLLLALANFCRLKGVAIANFFQAFPTQRRDKYVDIDTRPDRQIPQSLVLSSITWLQLLRKWNMGKTLRLTRATRRAPTATDGPSSTRPPSRPAPKVLSAMQGETPANFFQRFALVVVVEPRRLHRVALCAFLRLSPVANWSQECLPGTIRPRLMSSVVFSRNYESRGARLKLVLGNYAREQPRVRLLSRVVGNHLLRRPRRPRNSLPPLRYQCST